MPRQAGTQVVNKFVGGLVTEATALSFPDNACTETFNCVFDETGRVTRRLGIDIEETGNPTTLPVSGEVFTEFRWDAVTGDGSRSFIVQQVGEILYFFDISDTTEVHANDTGLTLDLSTFIPASSLTTPAAFPCQYATGRGRLVVANRAIDPVLVSYDPVTDEISGEAIEVRIRDFAGLTDGLEDSERPTSSVADLITNNPEHYYNLLNQSWFIGDALSQWDTARADVPSNRDYVALYRQDQDDAFDNTQVTANTPGTRLAPKGHFILNAWCPDHTQAMDDEGFTATIGSGETAISFSNINTLSPDDFDNFLNSERAFNGVTNTGPAGCAFRNAVQTGFIGGRFITPSRITKAVVYGSNNIGFISASDPDVTLSLYAKQGSTPPANSTDGTLLGTLAAFTDTADESGGRTVTSTDTDTFWDYVWIKIDQNGSNDQILVAEVTVFTVNITEDLFCTVERPSCVEFFAGRSWYAGVSFDRLSSRIYFSQIIQKDDQYGKCYQANDPASEDFTDLLADDGGVIVIPEIATVTRLFAYQSALLVVATNGVWLITGGSQGGFLATDFVVKKLSDEGSFSPLSFLSYKGVPAWWGENGIFSVQFDANYQSFAVVSLSDQKIKSFFDAIPVTSLPFVKGVFHIEDGIGAWLYNDTDAGYSYNSALLINGLSGAFYPWSIDADDTIAIRGAVYTRSPNAAGSASIRLPTTSGSNLFYSHARQSTYKDWSLLSVLLMNQDIEKDYDSYFITGYKLEGQALRFFQPNYIIVYNENESGCGSCFVQGVFDFTTTGNSGRWSTPQQVFNNCLTNRNVTYARRKIRGKGRSLQLRFSSESGKPFTIIGWAIWITGNAAV